tara:strand:- start:1 stop:171 length:171 start_codon:yes stop_codon:yes gene_type:complete
MNITSAKYKTSNKENDSIIVVADGQTLYVPIAPGNRHYQAVLEWAAIDGNNIEEAD